MRRVLTSTNAAEAHVGAAVLENAGIAAEIRGEFMGGLPMGPVSAPSLWVNEEDYEAACELLGVAPDRTADRQTKSPLRMLMAIVVALALLLLLQSVLTR
ncbi:MAG: DUF2007 domain-containing protein [Gemmatimonadota bacterium]